MSRDDDWDDEPNDERDSWQEEGRDDLDDDEQFSPYGAPPRPGMSTGMKVFVALLCFGGFCFLLCCGGVALWVNSLQKGITEDPDEIVARTKEIVEIEIPDNFEPSAAMRMDLFVVEIKAAVYVTKSEDGVLMLAEINTSIEDDGDDQEQQIRESLEFQGQQDRNLSIKNTELKEFEIRGQKVEFRFAEAEDEDGTAYRQVTGTFPGKEGTGFLMLQLPEEQYDEEATTKLIESIE